MSIELELYGYLQLNLPEYNIFNGKVDSDTGDKTISFFRLPGAIVQDNPITEIVWQISCRAREIDNCRIMAALVIRLLRGYYGKLDTINMRVLSIQDLGDIYEDEGRLCHIPLQVVSQIVS